MSICSFRTVVVLLAASITACRGVPPSPKTGCQASDVPSDRVNITVDGGVNHRVDTRWDVTASVAKPDGASCTVYIDVPRDTAAEEIAHALASAITDVCDVSATASARTGRDPGSGGDAREVQVIGARFGDIRVRKYERKRVGCRGCAEYMAYQDPKPARDRLRIKKVVSQQGAGTLTPALEPLAEVDIDIQTIVSNSVVELDLAGHRGLDDFELNYSATFPTGTTAAQALSAIQIWVLAHGFVARSPVSSQLVIVPPSGTTVAEARLGIWSEYVLIPEAGHGSAPHARDLFDVAPETVASDAVYSLWARH